MNYAFRITRPYDMLKETIERIAQSSTVLVVYEHDDASRTHIHGYVEGLTISTDTFKNWIKKELGVTTFPKSDWEFATKISKGLKKGQLVDRDALFYFHKGKYPILYNKGMPEEVITIKHGMSVAYYIDYKTPKDETTVKQVIEVEKKKTLKPTQWQISKMVQSQMYNEDGELAETRIREIGRMTIKTLKRNEILAHKRLVANIVQDIQAEFDTERYLNDIMNMV